MRESKYVRLATAGIMAGLACVLVAACSSSGGGGSSTKQGEESSSGGPAVTGQGGALVIKGEKIADAKLWAAAKKEGKFTYYTATPESTVDLLVKRFTKLTGIDVNVVRLSGGPLEERILSEVAGNKLAADVIQASDVTLVRKLQSGKDKVLAPYVVPTQSDVPASMRSPGNLYTPFGIPNMGIVYNSKLVKPSEAPKSWADLLDPKWKGKIGTFDIGDGGSAWSVALFERQKLGADYWQKLAAQDPGVFMGHAPLTAALERGEVEVGIASPGYEIKKASDGAPVQAVFPKEGLTGWVSFISLVAGADHPAAAKVFINWATSKHGEGYYVSVSGDYPVNEKVPPPVVDGVQFPEQRPWVPSASDWVDLRTKWTKEYRDLFGSAS